LETFLTAQPFSEKHTDLRVGVFGFEPALQRPLEILLAAEPGLSVVRHSNLPECPPDVLIIAPPNADWVDRLQSRFPQARMLAMVEWCRRDQFVAFPIRGYFDPFQGYSGLLELVRQQLAA
jgi:hypothetical protein